MRNGRTPLVILAGTEYGTGSSRDWAAKGTRLLGVKAVVAASFERIHRSNLVGMGVLPLQFLDGTTAQTLGLDGSETFSITGLSDSIQPGQQLTLEIQSEGRQIALGAGEVADRYADRDRLLSARRDFAVRAAPVAGSQDVAAALCRRVASARLDRRYSKNLSALDSDRRAVGNESGARSRSERFDELFAVKSGDVRGEFMVLGLPDFPARMFDPIFTATVANARCSPNNVP